MDVKKKRPDYEVLRPDYDVKLILGPPELPKGCKKSCWQQAGSICLPAGAVQQLTLPRSI